MNTDLKYYLESVIQQIETSDYIHSDPVQFMHAFDEKRDQEISGFFAATLAWGKRSIVNQKVSELLERMDHKPAQFIYDFKDKSFNQLKGFKHRTFTDEDIFWLITILHRIYRTFPDLEAFWLHLKTHSKSEHFVQDFHNAFFDFAPEATARTHKHIANGAKNSACKRLFLYLRWAVRQNSSVDLGIYHSLDASDLRIPLDVHVARIARLFGLMNRKQNDWKALTELHNQLKIFDSYDPAKYDYALFGIGALNLDIPKELVLHKSD